MTDRSQPESFGAGVRLPYAELPDPIKEWIGSRLGGPVVRVRNHRGGFSPGVAASVETAAGLGLFVKAVTDAINVDSLQIYRNERDRCSRLPDLPGVVKPNGSVELVADGQDWIVLTFGLLPGAPPHHPWSGADALRTLDHVHLLGKQLTPSPWPAAEAAGPEMLDFLTGWRQVAEAGGQDPWLDDPWVSAHSDILLTLNEETRAELPGDSLVHFDLRADNIMISGSQVWIVDWAHARNAARWIDPVLLVADIIASGADIDDGGEIDIRRLLDDHPALTEASPRLQFGLLSGLAASLHAASVRPPPPALPTIRGWQARTAEAMMAFIRRHLDDAVRRKGRASS